MRTELHFHLLPGVDDGPRDDQEAIELARLAVADGTSRVVATPHVRRLALEELPMRVAQLRARLREAEVPLELRAGGELSPDDVGSLGPRQLDLLAHGPPDRRWLLLEAPLISSVTTLEAAAAELSALGFGVLIAHPERSASTPMPRIREQVAAGAMLQVNASSVTGGHGPDARRVALAVARSGLPFVLASDAHSGDRPPLLAPARAALLSAGVQEGTVHAAVDVLPEVLLQRGLGAAGSTRPPHPADHPRRSRLGQRERVPRQPFADGALAPVPISRSAQVFLDRPGGL